MRFPVRLIKDDEGFAVRFPDVPEAITQGDTREDALRHAADALETALDFYFDEKRAVPTPSVAKRGQAYVDLPASVAATVLLYNEMLRQEVRPAELAKRIGIPRQDMTRMLNLRHSTKIDSIADALRHLGKRLDFQLL